MASKPGSRAKSGGKVAVGEAHATAILDAALDAVITIDYMGHVLEFNRAAEQIFGYQKNDVVGRELAELIVPPESRDAHRAALAKWTEHGPGKGAGALLGRRIEVAAMRADGSVFPAELAIGRVDIPGPPVFTACIRDISEQRAAEDDRRRAENRYRSLVEQLPLAVYIDRMDEASSNVYTSPQVESMLGYPPEEWATDEMLFVRVLHPDDRERVLAAHARTHATGEPLHVEYRLLAKDGRVVWVHDEARVIGSAEEGDQYLQGYLLDITARREAEEQLRHQAFHDALTGLANRALFTDRVQHALVVRAEKGDAAVLIVDLDEFKTINDSLGHAAGDSLLAEVGRRLRAVLSETHTVARIGGDEFAILVESPSGLPAAVGIAENVLTQFEIPFQLDGREVFTTASVGIAIGQDGEGLLRSADVALYRAKAGGGARYVVHGPKMNEDVFGRLELIADLRRARIEDEFVVHYQPIVELATGRLVSVEALVRWKHPERGLLQPADFVQLAEETGRIVDIGRWVLTAACRQTAEWKAGLPLGTPFTVSVNVSTRQVRRHEILDDIVSALESSGLEPRTLGVEITESVFADRREEMVEVLRDVMRLGVGIALDDFGTGYSSLPLLQELPVGTIKIDRYFVNAIGTGPERNAFVRAIVDLAKALDLEIIAEGIESPAHVAVLRHLGCRFGQGFHYSTPLPSAELSELMAHGAVPTFPLRTRALGVKVA